PVLLAARASGLMMASVSIGSDEGRGKRDGLEARLQQRNDIGRPLHHRDPGLLECFHLVGGGRAGAGVDGARVAHAPSRPPRRADGAVCQVMKPTPGFSIFCLTKSPACCPSEPPISPIMTTALVSASFSNAARQSMKPVPMIGSPPMPTQEDCP